MNAPLTREEAARLAVKFCTIRKQEPTVHAIKQRILRATRKQAGLCTQCKADSKGARLCPRCRRMELALRTKRAARQEVAS